MNHKALAVSLVAALLALSACSDRETIGTDSHNPTIPQRPDAQPEPLPGATDFVSADGYAGQDTQENQDPAEPGADEDGAFGDGERDDNRTVEEGDIYRVLDGSRILNLNAFRGLQVVNFQDVDQPVIEGRAAMTGYPVEMYVVDDHAYVLMNNWRGYWVSRHDTRPEQYQGGLLVSVDISDPANPFIVGKARVPGYIRTSRLTRSSRGIALYAVANWYGEYEDDRGDTQNGSFTYVKSFHLTGGAIADKTELNLGGYVGDVQATPDALLVSRIDWNRNEARSTISLIDITDPTGTMIEGDSVEVSGYVANKYNMDLDNGILRVVSGATWGNTRTNHVQTFDASDFRRLVLIDEATFGDDENLFATLFLGEKAFFVTYRQVDPFHAFHISPEGIITEKAEYIISGFNSYFRAVEGGDRLLGIGIDDQDGRTLAVSLYDITNLENPDPFIGRQHVDADNSWGESQWDDRAFSVLENAVDVEGPNGVRETGLVLLPYSGWNRDRNEYIAAVQIFTFSRDTLTQRGSMKHGSPVRRSFLADDQTTTNMSEIAMSFFDHSDPDAPREQGRVELAPNYTDYWVFGDYGVRLKNGRDYYWWYSVDQLPDNVVDIVPLSADPDLAQPVATIEVPASSQLSRVGDLLIAIDMQPVDNNGRRVEEFRTEIHVFDLSDPANPQTRGSLTTTRLRPNYGYYGYYNDGDCWDCYWWGYTNFDVREVDNALVFPRPIPNRRLLGQQETCNTYPTNRRGYDCWDDDGPKACTYYSGSIRCSTLNDGPEHCTGSVYQCNQDEEGQTTCDPIEADDVETQTNCYEREAYRYWQSYEFNVVDLSNPDRPRLADTVTMPSNQEAVSVRHFGGSDLYVNYRIPVEVDEDTRPFVRHYTKRVDLTNPSRPQIDMPINVPGEVIATANDGQLLFTQDTVWGSNIIETAINKLAVEDGAARLVARQRFEDQQVYAIRLDDSGNLLVSHRLAWRLVDHNNRQDVTSDLTIFDASRNLRLVSTMEVDTWAALQEVKRGRALFSVPGGLLVMNLDDPSQPYAQGYFPTNGWPRAITVEGDDIFFAAGRYGIQRFGLDEFNLELH